jgi:hypothetical protein
VEDVHSHPAVICQHPRTSAGKGGLYPSSLSLSKSKIRLIIIFLKIIIRKEYLKATNSHLNIALFEVLQVMSRGFFGWWVVSAFAEASADESWWVVNVQRATFNVQRATFNGQSAFICITADRLGNV